MMTNLLRFDFNDRDGIFEVVENGDWVRATDYDALAAKLAEVEEGWIDAAVKQQVRRKRAEARLLEVEAELADAERVARYETDVAQQALDQMKAAEAALPAVYLLGLANAAIEIECNWGHIATPRMREAIRLLPTPTAAELMARIQTGEKK